MIEISNISKTYENGGKALRDINITIEDGEFVFIMGRSGSGKSTLLKLMLKEAEPTSGRIVINDMDLQKMPRRYVPKFRRKLGVVFQDFRLLKDRTVFENVAAGGGGLFQKYPRICSKNVKAGGAFIKIQDGAPEAFRRGAAAGGDCPRSD